MFKKNKKNIFLIIFGYIVLILPFIYFVIFKYGDYNYFINLSHDINLHKYFLDLKTGQFWIGGGYTFGECKYFFFYFFEYIFKIIFGKQLYAFFFMVILYIFIGYIGFLKLFLILRKNLISKNIISYKELGIFIFIIVIFFSSLSFFQLWKGNFFLISGYYLIPIMIYYAIKFYSEKGILNLIIPLFFVLLYFPTNFTFVVIFFILLNIFLFSLGYNFKLNIKRILLINLVYFIYFLPYTLLTLYPLLHNTGDALKTISSETFYSNRAYLLNIFNQTNFWGLFGSWNGNLRFNYSTFYRKFLYLGYLVFILLLLLFINIKKKDNKRLFLFTLFIFLGIIIFIEFSLGYHSIIYNYFYNNTTVFKIFRNVTKLQPGLYFLIFIVIGLIISYFIYNKKNIKIYLLILLIIFFYNLPYFYQTDYIVNKNKFIYNIPQYWFNMAKYINKNINKNEIILDLPKFYSIGQYNIYGKKVGFEGFLEDKLFNIRTYHLNEGFIKNDIFAKSFLNMQYKCKNNIRKKCTNFNKFNKFLLKNKIKCILFEYDAINEYDNLNDFKKSILNIGYKKNYGVGKLELYCKK